MRRKYTKEFKMKACESVLRDGMKHTVVAEKIGIHVVMLYRWISEYKLLGDDAFAGMGYSYQLKAKVKRLEKENERLQMENEFLKKSMANLTQSPMDEPRPKV